MPPFSRSVVLHTILFRVNRDLVEPLMCKSCERVLAAIAATQTTDSGITGDSETRRSCGAGPQRNGGIKRSRHLHSVVYSA